MTEYRCIKCNALLFIGKIIGSIQIKCRKCGYINEVIKTSIAVIYVDDRLKEDEFILKTK